jgi:hypothetical protein
MINQRLNIINVTTEFMLGEECGILLYICNATACKEST